MASKYVSNFCQRWIKATTQYIKYARRMSNFNCTILKKFKLLKKYACIVFIYGSSIIVVFEDLLKCCCHFGFKICHPTFKANS